MVLFVATLVVAAAGSAHALVISTYNGPGTPNLVNTTAPADDPGWANASSLRGALYLGDQWVITANHVQTKELVLPSGTYHPIPGQVFTLTNPSSFLGTSLDTQSDLKLFRVDTEEVTGLTPEQMDPNVRTIQIAPETAPVGTDVTTIARGSTRNLHPTLPNGRQHYTSTFNTTVDLDAPYTGFRFPNPIVTAKSWGTNEIAPASGVPGVTDNGVSGIITAGGIFDVVGQFTRFDESLNPDGSVIPGGGTLDEFQGAAGDSGSPVFAKYDFAAGEFVERDETGEWVLTGVFHVIYALQGQPNSVPIFGQHTGISDLSLQHYSDQIAAFRASDEYSVIGDIDLDGQVTGEIVNGVPTGDLSVLVDNWLNQETQPDIISWKKGDLNQDGLTTLADFVMLRDALGGTISVSEFSLLVSGLGIPEPTAATLLLAGATGLLATRRVRQG